LSDTNCPEAEVLPILDIYEVLEDNIIEEIKKLCHENEEEIDEELNEDNKESIVNKDKDNNSVNKSVKILVTGKGKFEREKIHKAIRDNFSKLETFTVDEETDKYIIVKKESDNRGRKRYIWPKSKGEFVHFVLYKENKETQLAINELALKMHISPKIFSIAGTKDKRAITTQMVCAWKVPPKKVWFASQNSQSTKVGNFTFQKEVLRLGDLKGNHFDIILRDVKCDDRDEAEKALNSVKDIGFINYFGMQRFGLYHNPYKIGVLILKRKWEEVVDNLLTAKPNDIIIHKNPNAMTFNECMELWKTTKNAKLVYEKLCFKSTPEGTLLKGLSRVQPNDFHGALCTGMVRNSRLLHIHCYQSYVWNRAASYRFKTYGLKVVVGDLLSFNSKSSESELEIDDNDNKDSNDTNSSNVKKFRSDIVYADESNINKASIYDIVIPIIGSESLLPKNSTSDFIQSVLSEDEITIDLFRDLPKQWSVSGSYRKLFIKPENLNWSWIPYKDPNKTLIETDLNLINKTKSLKTESEPETNENETEKIALKLSMCLPSSCYATMMCREITKTESTVLEYKSYLENKFDL
jgi:tRNA pseudouridine13 synthase